ncbi:hypothetical protein [Legionella genomosp. 1]|uniref:hypothetical protein n=1 Tax=Legionella genomosp. 1 TaxID=1093625 RepID=UPI0010567D03|nr:hypothetical protein [Legionella genomosp. 1]
MEFSRLFFLLILCCLFPDVHAGISVGPIVVDLTSKNKDAEIAVRNLDINHQAYIEVIPYHLANPARLNSAKIRVRNPEKDGLMVFPAKLVLLPGQTQFVRVVKTASKIPSEKVFEIDFIPKIATHLVSQKSPEGAVLGIRVIVGYGARVTLRPDKPLPSISIKRKANELLIVNTGNASVRITSCTQTIAGQKKEIPLPAYTLFAGQTLKKQLVQLTPVNLQASFMDKSLGSFTTD